MKRFTLAFFIVFLFSSIAFSQNPPLPPEPEGKPLSDNNVKPVIESYSISPSTLNHLETLTIEIEASDDSGIKAFYFYYTQSSDKKDWKKIKLDNVEFNDDKTEAEASLEITPDITGTLFTMIRCQDEENGETDSEIITIEVVSAIPEIPQNFKVLGKTDVTIEFQWEKSEAANTYRIDLSTDEDFTTSENRLIQDEEYTEEIIRYTVENLLRNTNYFVRISAENRFATSEYSDTIQVKTPEVAAKITLQEQHLDFNTLSQNQGKIYTIPISGTNFESVLKISTTNGISLSLDQQTWVSATEILEIVPVDHKIPNTTLYAKILPEQTGDFDEDILFSSIGMATQTIKITGFVIANHPKQSPTLSNCYCDIDGKINIKWEWDITKMIPDSVLISIVRTNKTLELENSEEKTKQFSTLNNEGHYKVSSEDQEIQIENIPKEKSFNIYLVGVNGYGKTANYHTVQPATKGTIVTRLNEDPKIWLNEFIYNPPGTDENEKLEICYYAEEVNKIEREKISVHLVNGSNGKFYKSYNLTAENSTLRNNGEYVFITLDLKTIQNGPDGIAILYNQKPIEFISYKGSFEGLSLEIYGLISTDILINGDDVGINEKDNTDTSIQRTDPESNNGAIWQIANSTWGKENTFQLKSKSSKWKGNEASEWTDESNWSNGIPTSSTHVVIPRNSRINISEEENILLTSLQIEPDAQLIGEEKLPVGIPIYVQRDFEVDRWSYFSSPLECLHAGWLTPEKGVLYLIEYNKDEEQEELKWQYIIDRERSLHPMEGYGVYNSREVSCFCFSGFFATRDPSITLTYEEDKDNFHFVGNPYVSGITWPIEDTENITGTAYLYSPAHAGYITINKDGESTHNFGNEIPPLQGFFVESIKEGTISLTKNDRVFTSSEFLKSKPLNKLELQVSNKKYTDIAICYQADDAENGFVPTSDSKKFFFNDFENPQIAILCNSVPVAISRVEQMEEKIQFQLKIENPQVLKLKLSNLNLLQGEEDFYELWSIDKDTLVTAGSESTMSVELNLQDLEAKNRFEIRRKSLTPVSPSYPQSTWKLYSEANSIVIESSFTNTKKIEIYSIEGKTVYLDKSPNETVNRIKLKPGIYLVQRNNEKARKIIVH